MSRIKRSALIGFLLLGISSGLAIDAQYLIITADRFYEKAQPLAQWKNKKGIRTKVVKLSEIGGNDSQAIRTYIRNGYNNWYPRLEYVLLVGDINFISPYNHPSCGPTDNPYADVNGDAQLELCIGRLPCRNYIQLKSMINKIFSYERTPYLAETLWYRKATTIRQDPGPYHNAGTYFVRSMFLDYGNYLSVDTFVAPNHNAKDVCDSLVQGRSYVLYTGHGGGTHWYAPFNLNPIPIKNGRKLPVIFSWSCQTVLKERYLGQLWLKTGSSRKPKGAVAYIGTTTSGLYARYRNFVARNFFRAILQYQVLNIGKALKQGLDSLWTYTPDSFGQILYSEWNLLGDPELNLWTQVPKPMLVTHPPTISTSPQSFLVQVMGQDSIPIKNGLVCLMSSRDATFYYYGYTDNQGEINFAINPLRSDTIAVTVTAQNFIPYEGKCVISPHFSSNVRTLGYSFIGDHSLPNRQSSTLRIYDVSGNLIKVQKLENLNHKEVQIVLKGLRSGIYFVNLEGEKSRATKKIILVK